MLRLRRGMSMNQPVSRVQIGVGSGAVRPPRVTPEAAPGRSESRLLRKLRAFLAPSRAEVEAIEDIERQFVRVPANRHLADEGARATHVQVICDGWAMRYNVLRDGRRQIANLLVPGDFACAHAMLFETADDNVATLTTASIARVERDAALALVAAHPRLGLAIARLCALEETMLRERLVSIGSRSLRERAAHFLLELSSRLELVGLAEDGSFEMPVSQAIVADCLGVSAVHVSKTLTALRAEGLIEVSRCQPRTVRIRNRARLAEVAGFRPGYLHLDEARSPHP